MSIQVRRYWGLSVAACYSAFCYLVAAARVAAACSFLLCALLTNFFPLAPHKFPLCAHAPLQSDGDDLGPLALGRTGRLLGSVASAPRPSVRSHAASKRESAHAAGGGGDEPLSDDQRAAVDWLKRHVKLKGYSPAKWGPEHDSVAL